MSLDHARAFIQKMKTNEAFRKSIMAIEDVDVLLAVAKSEGFEITDAELKDVHSELTDDELNSVAAGFMSEIQMIQIQNLIAAEELAQHLMSIYSKSMSGTSGGITDNLR